MTWINWITLIIFYGLLIFLLLYMVFQTPTDPIKHKRGSAITSKEKVIAYNVWIYLKERWPNKSKQELANEFEKDKEYSNFIWSSTPVKSQSCVIQMEEDEACVYASLSFLDSCI